MRAFPLLCALLLAAGLGAANQPPARLDVTARPETTRVYVDGVSRGTVQTGTLNVFDLEPGRHLLHLEAPGYRVKDEFFTIAEGEFLRRDFELSREKGLLLLQSSPAGADVKQGGVSVGVTPLLLTELPTDSTYAFELSLPGYQSKRIDVALAGRRPVVRTETLTLDSGLVTVSSEPSGAEVLLGGVSRGRTPLSLSRIPKGAVTVEVQLPGYRTEKRELRIQPGVEERLDFRLKGLPAQLTVVSAPEGARVLMDDEYKGKTPVEMTDVSPGLHVLRLELQGFAPNARTIVLENGERKTEEFAFESILGRIEVTTTPPGAKVMVDGRSFGTTSAKTATATKSDVFTVDKIEAGEHTVTVNLQGYREASRKVMVEAKKSVQTQFRLKRMFVPDTEIDTATGTYKGVLITPSPPDVVRLEVREGITQDFRRENIRGIRPIEP